MWFKYGLKAQKLLAQGVWGHYALLMPGACGDTMVFWYLGRVELTCETWVFLKLLRFLMISKGSWVAFATCSAESPIASKRCAVSVLASCLPSTLPSSILPGKVAEKVLWLHASTWRRILKWFSQLTQVVQSSNSSSSVSEFRRLS